MTQEEAERRQTQESYRSEAPAQSTSIDDPSQFYRSGPSGYGLDPEPSATSPQRSPAVEKTMRKAQKQADKSTSAEKGRSGSEEEKPDRILRTTEETRGPTLLPVVSEAGEIGEQSEKHTLSPADERAEYDSALSTSPPPMNHPSIPGLRRVSPSTVGTATDMADDTSAPSSPTMGFEPDPQMDRDPTQERVEPIRGKPPRIASDLIQPQSPLGDSLMKSMFEHIGTDP
jgi:hypothetical protein